jgi:apolipoprotein N-acyltransferase
MGQANFEHGEEVVIYEVDGFRFAPLICFEIAFPLFLRDIVKEHNPDFFVTITNDAWFYRSIGTHQHAIKAAFRTIETRKSIFRAANTGYSFYTTPDGKIHNKTDLFERTYITGNLWTYDTLTPYLSYGFVIYFIFFVFFALQITTILICWLSGKKKRVNNGEDLL